jgi:hypothetical protein
MGLGLKAQGFRFRCLSLRLGVYGLGVRICFWFRFIGLGSGI